jgi:magnesium-transporting ATPase (P-type)
MSIDSSCYENTSALDGEAVPKLRIASTLTMSHVTPESVGELRGAVTLKAPTAALHSFEGRIIIQSDLVHSLTSFPFPSTHTPYS